MTETTEPLRNGAKLPTHPADTTARKIIKYGEVRDAHTGITCGGGLHRSEIQMLRSGEKGGLAHLFRYAIVQEGAVRKIYHTRSRVVVEVETVPVEDS